MKYLKYLIVFLLLGAAFSCELEDNVNPKEVVDAPAVSLFTNAQYALIHQVNNLDQNFNNSRLYAQYNAQTTYPDESQWDFYNRSLPDRMWREIYRDALMDFQEAKRLVDEFGGFSTEQKSAHNAMIDVLEVYGYHVLVDCNGDVPYTEALGARENPVPVYDDAETIYIDLINRLTSDVAVFGTTSMAAHPFFQDGDILYGGDMKKWMKFANSLKLRLGMRLADFYSDAGLSRTACEEAITSGVFESSDDNAEMVYPGVTPYTSTVYQEMNEQGRKDFVAANTIVDVMNTLNDPRRAYYFTTVGGSYIGGEYGFSNNYFDYSHFSDELFNDATFPAPLIEYTEVEFLLAEAAARGYTVSGTAEDHYKAAVSESVISWGGTQVQADNYLAQTEVGYNTGASAGNFREKIGMQKWIALYNQGLEGWVAVRMYDAVDMNVPDIEGYTEDDYPLRMPYPFDEDNLNPVNYAAAAAAIGGDESTTPLFWDLYDRNGVLY